MSSVHIVSSVAKAELTMQDIVSSDFASSVSTCHNDMACVGISCMFLQ